MELSLMEIVTFIELLESSGSIIGPGTAKDYIVKYCSYLDKSEYGELMDKLESRRDEIEGNEL